MSPWISKKQEKWMWTNKPKMAKEWEDKYGTFKKKSKKLKK